MYSADQRADGDYDWNTTRPGENPDDVDQDTQDVWIDVSALKPGGAGGRVYAIAANYAHNTGRMFIGDPSGLTDVAMRRRSEHMLSSALKFGTTRHLAPHLRQTQGDSKIGVPALKWVYGDDLGNIRRLVDLNLKALDNAFPSAKKIDFDAAAGQFRNADTGGPVERLALAERVRARRSDGASGASMGEAGGRTLARGAVLRALLREESAGSGGEGRRDGLLARLARLGSDSPQAVDALFSQRQPPAPGSTVTAQSLVDAKGGVFDFNRLGATKQDRIRTVVDGARQFWLPALTRDPFEDVSATVDHPATTTTTTNQRTGHPD